MPRNQPRIAYTGVHLHIQLAIAVKPSPSFLTKLRPNLFALRPPDSFAAAAAPQSAISQSTSASESTTSEPIAAPEPLATSLAAAAVTGTFVYLMLRTDPPALRLSSSDLEVV